MIIFSKQGYWFVRLWWYPPVIVVLVLTACGDSPSNTLQPFAGSAELADHGQINGTNLPMMPSEPGTKDYLASLAIGRAKDWYLKFAYVNHGKPDSRGPSIENGMIRDVSVNKFSKELCEHYFKREIEYSISKKGPYNPRYAYTYNGRTYVGIHAWGAAFCQDSIDELGYLYALNNTCFGTGGSCRSEKKKELAHATLR